MYSLLTLTCFVVAVFGAPDFNTRILGGKNAKSGQFKHQVSLRQYGQHFCGGSIIAPTKILTAAHCVNGLKTSISVAVGETSLSASATTYKVSSIVAHPNFDPDSLVNDVAVLTLESSINYNNKVQPIKLAETNPPKGSTVSLSGWGLTSYPGDIPNNLQFINLEVLDNKQCAKKLSNISSQQVCTTSPMDTGACKGDSGGPLIDQNGVQVGVVSWGVPCGLEHPDVFASVAYFRKWILSN